VVDAQSRNVGSALTFWRIQDNFSRTRCCRIICFVLRLLSTEAYFTYNRYLHRKRFKHQRGAWTNSAKSKPQVLSGRRDIIVVASVSCIYGMGNPTDYESGIVRISKGDRISRQGFYILLF
jgi:hypothetical protein